MVKSIVINIFLIQHKINNTNTFCNKIHFGMYLDINDLLLVVNVASDTQKKVGCTN
jgi:hypothetical protein